MANQPQIFWTHAGETLSIHEWSAKTGIPYPTLYMRREIHRMSLEKTLSARHLRRGPEPIVTSFCGSSSKMKGL
jgi:hypothetical protein